MISSLHDARGSQWRADIAAEWPVTDVPTQKGRTYFQGWARNRMNLDGGTVAFHRQRHFLRARFPFFFFFPWRHWSAAARSCDTATGEFARAKFNFLRPIDFFSFSFPFFPSFFPAVPFFSRRDGIVKKEKKRKAEAEGRKNNRPSE